MSAQPFPGSDSTLLWLLLQRLGFTAALVRRLFEHDPDGDVAQWLSPPPAHWRQWRVAEETLAALAEWQRCGHDSAAARCARADLGWLRRHGATLLHLGHPDYPPLLQEIADPPPWLYVRGDVGCLGEPQLAVVGSRRPTHRGLGDAADFAGALAAEGFVVTSGLAYGIDAAAHRAALEAGGCTVAVLGSGLDRIYPARHADLAAAVAGRGALLSELPLGTPPRPQQFPSRNRIISGLSLGTLVVEAMPKSGSLVTARLALEQGREVFALPGSIHNPASRGCNALIRQGAVLVQEVADILAELRGWIGPLPAAAGTEAGPPQPVGGDEAATLAAIGFEPTALELIVERAALPVGLVLAALSELELAGLVESRAGAWLRCGGR
jgi:DNA processing protein